MMAMIIGSILMVGAVAVVWLASPDEDDVSGYDEDVRYW